MNRADASAPSPDIVMRAEQVSKIFPGTTALDGVDFNIRAGAVNVLVGENGAGKSTLMKILAGVEQPSAGRILLNGEEVSFRSVRDAARHGIGIVFQELNLCPNLSVAENLSLVGAPTRLGIDIDRATQADRARQLLARLDHPIDPFRLVGDLRIGEQQIVEIAKALAADASVLIMDEPSSALSNTEVETLFRVISDLKRRGVAVVYISHRLEEIVRIGDYITVLRDGHLQSEARVADIDVPWIIAQMVGPIEIAAGDGRRLAGEPLLVVEDVVLPRASGGYALDSVSLTVRAGEIVAIYGLLGAGRSELFECLIGAEAPASGRILLSGHAIGGLSIADRIHRGLVLVPEDRQREGIVQLLPVSENLTLASIRKFTRHWTIDRASEATAVARSIRDLGIKVSSPDVLVSALSGGNQQKVVIGKGLLTEPRVIMLDEPTRGIDVGAKAEVFRTMADLAEKGIAVIYATSDIKEVMTTCDRIVVMSSGRITGDFRRTEVTEEMVVAASTVGLTDAARDTRKLAS
jgi:erythritol transport system ATP-binding protein